MRNILGREMKKVDVNIMKELAKETIRLLKDGQAFNSLKLKQQPDK